MILQTDKDFLPIVTNGNKLKLEVKIELESKRLIRREFDKAVFDYEALAAIKMANQLGFKDLAEEMEADYYLNLEVQKEDKEAA